MGHEPVLTEFPSGFLVKTFRDKGKQNERSSAQVQALGKWRYRFPSLGRGGNERAAIHSQNRYARQTLYPHPLPASFSLSVFHTRPGTGGHMPQLPVWTIRTPTILRLITRGFGHRRQTVSTHSRLTNQYMRGADMQCNSTRDVWVGVMRAKRKIHMSFFGGMSPKFGQKARKDIVYGGVCGMFCA